MQSILLTVFIALHVISCWAQFPAVCNTNESISSKTCCPNNCGGIINGECTNIKSRAVKAWSLSNPDVIAYMLNSTNIPGKGKADMRYQWPTVVFENVCMCTGNYYGPDCTDCKFGYTGTDCNTKAPIRMRKQFSSLTAYEKEQLIRGFSELKNEYGRYAVAVDDPPSYTNGGVTLQNVTTFDMITYLHFLVARETNCNLSNTIDFAHEGPVFPVWHRHYLLTLEREFQRILSNSSFSLPYWSWESSEMDMFTVDYLGTPATNYSQVSNVTASYFNESNWPMVCDLMYRNQSVSCGEGWQLCNPNRDRQAQRPLQRGVSYNNSYLPDTREIKIAIAAPSYESSGTDGLYDSKSPRTSFRNRLEGFTEICSVTGCVGYNVKSHHHMHNIIHLWIGGHMGVVPSAANDPIFFLHHCNVDRVLESWIRRFDQYSSNSMLLPGYTPSRGGHPGHNKDSWMVPFFPPVTPQDYYQDSTNFGYTYEKIFEADVDDSSLIDCDSTTNCPSCASNGSCIMCALNETIQCPTPILAPSTSNKNIALGLGLGLGIPLLISLIALVVSYLIIGILVYCLVSNKKVEQTTLIE